MTSESILSELCVRSSVFSVLLGNAAIVGVTKIHKFPMVQKSLAEIFVCTADGVKRLHLPWVVEALLCSPMFVDLFLSRHVASLTGWYPLSEPLYRSFDGTTYDFRWGTWQALASHNSRQGH